MITFFDDRTAVGGGQVVLAELLRRLDGEGTPTALVGPPHADIRALIPGSTRLIDSTSSTARIDKFDGGTEGEVLVANTYATTVAVRRTARRLRRSARAVTTVSVLHSYPSNRMRRVVARRLIAGTDATLVVEPGLAPLSRHVVDTPMLSVRSEQVRALDADPIRPTRDLKTFGRPDRVKGLDLFPAVARLVETDSTLRPRIALGASLDGDDNYADSLRAAVGAWLESGRRDASWIAAGDLVLVTSLSETTCLTAQEALAAGAFVIASDVGVLPGLETGRNALTTFPVGDVTAAAAAVLAASRLPAEEFDARCRASNEEMRGRADAWYVAAATHLTNALRSSARPQPQLDGAP